MCAPSTRTYTQIHTPTVVQGRGMNGTLPQSFWYVAVFQNYFTFSGKPLIFLTRWVYILWVVALLETCDVTNNSPQLGFYQDLEIRLKPREMAIFLCLTWTITHKWALCMILATRFNFIVEKGFKQTMASPPSTYYVISRDYRNWLSLGLTKNARKG